MNEKAGQAPAFLYEKNLKKFQKNDWQKYHKVL